MLPSPIQGDSIPEPFHPTILRLLDVGITPQQIAITQQFMSKYDPSHDFIHVLRVVALAFSIFDTEVADKALLITSQEDNKDLLLILAACALFHDINDHKYATSDESIHHTVFSQVLSPLTPSHQHAVEVIIDNISYSKQVKRGGSIPDLDTMIGRPQMTHIRNIVSDADKIDAIGNIGIARCAHYAIHAHTQSTVTQQSHHDVHKRGVALPLSLADVAKAVVDHSHEKLLRLLPLFIYTQSGKALAQPHHDDLLQWVRETEEYLKGGDQTLTFPPHLNLWHGEHNILPNSSSC